MHSIVKLKLLQRYSNNQTNIKKGNGGNSRRKWQLANSQPTFSNEKKVIYDWLNENQIGTIQIRLVTIQFNAIKLDNSDVIGM